MRSAVSHCHGDATPATMGAPDRPSQGHPVRVASAWARAARRHAATFARNESGAVTIEAVLWIPLFVGILMLITDASLAFFSKAEAMRVIEAGNRAFAVDPDATKTDTQTWVRNQFAALAPRAKATTSTDNERDIVFTELSYPASDVTAFNTLGVVSGWEITVRAMQYVERDLK